jgi:DNA repair ATPase RecN
MAQMSTENPQTTLLRRYEQALDQRFNGFHLGFKSIHDLSNTIHSNQAVLNTDHRSLASQMTHYIQVQNREHAALKTLFVSDREQEQERKRLKEREREREKESERVRQQKLEKEREKDRQRERKGDHQNEEMLKILNQLDQRFQNVEAAVEKYGKRVDLLALGMSQIDKKFGPLTSILQESEFTLKEVYETVKDPAAFGQCFLYSDFSLRVPICVSILIFGILQLIEAQPKAFRARSRRMMA